MQCLNYLPIVIALHAILLAGCSTIPEDAGKGWFDREIVETPDGRKVIRESPHERHQRYLERIDQRTAR